MFFRFSCFSGQPNSFRKKKRLLPSSYKYLENTINYRKTIIILIKSNVFRAFRRSYREGSTIVPTRQSEYYFDGYIISRTLATNINTYLYYNITRNCIISFLLGKSVKESHDEKLLTACKNGFFFYLNTPIIRMLVYLCYR